MKRLLYSVLLTAMVISCGGRKAPVTAKQADAPAVEFNADSAFSFVKEQTDFGPRVPNTQAHDDCGIWLAARLSSFGADKVFVQNFNTKTFDNTTLKCMNIVGSFNLECPTRVILCSHWDSRPWADNDSDPSKHKTPVDAANDGASGVAVILEIARQLQKQAPQIGVDCIFFDAEDWGSHDESDSWALGAQYWAKNISQQPSAIKPRYGILLDMVGGQGARFYQEGYSKYYANHIVKRVWKAAAIAGFSSYFPQEDGGGITDDHGPVNEVAGIPCIDIINYYPECEQSSFGPTWHTIHDDMDHLDRNTLKAVGQTLIQVIYTEK